MTTLTPARNNAEDSPLVKDYRKSSFQLTYLGSAYINGYECDCWRGYRDNESTNPLKEEILISDAFGVSREYVMALQIRKKKELEQRWIIGLVFWYRMKFHEHLQQKQ